MVGKTHFAKSVLFSLTPLLVLFAVLEGGLWLLGLPAQNQIHDPYVGFAAEIPLFIQTTGEGGDTRMRTAANKLRFFNDQEFSSQKAPGARRVFCLGGSTTYGRPYRNATSFCGWLGRYLQLASPETKWEVINAGGISYASYRATALMEELTNYEPDLFVVYSGHNEFLEERTYRSLRERPAALRWLDLRLRSLRSVAALELLLTSIRGSGPAPEGREQLSAEVETRLESSLGPAAYQRDDALSEAIVEHYRLNLERMVALARGSGAQLMLVVPADNLSASSPFKSEPSGALSPDKRRLFAASLERARVQMKAEQWGVARASFEQAVEIDSRHAHALYGLGRASLALGDVTRARQELTRARDEDICPLRAISPIVEAVRGLPSNFGVKVIDFPRLLAGASSPAGVPPGENWFLDHVHPTIEGHQLLAKAVLREVAALGWLSVGVDGLAEELELLDQQVRETLDSKEHGVAFRNLAKVMGWAGKYEDAARMARRALDVLGDDSESYFLLAINASAVGDHEQAVAFLREALRIEPSWSRVRHNLAIELSRSQRYEEALAHYDRLIQEDPGHHSLTYNRANTLLKLDRLDEAIAGFRSAIEQDPEDIDARYNLARAYKRAERPELARVELEMLLEIDSEDRDARAELESLVEQVRPAPSRLDDSHHALEVSERRAELASGSLLAEELRL